MCSKFPENRGILKPILRNHDKGVFFYLKFHEIPPKRGISCHRILSFLEICQLSIVFNEPVIVQYAMMLERVFLK